MDGCFACLLVCLTFFSRRTLLDGLIYSLPFQDRVKMNFGESEIEADESATKIGELNEQINSAHHSSLTATDQADREPQTQLWSLVREISNRLTAIPATSPLNEYADKLSRLKDLNERCLAYETQLKCTFIALLKERNTYLDLLQQVHIFGEEHGWESKNNLLQQIKTILYAETKNHK